MIMQEFLFISSVMLLVISIGMVILSFEKGKAHYILLANLPFLISLILLSVTVQLPTDKASATKVPLNSHVRIVDVHLDSPGHNGYQKIEFLIEIKKGC